MIATVTLNPALDVTITVDELALGESMRTPAAHRRAGGKGINVSRVLSGEGIPTTALVCVGGPAGEEFARELTHAGVPHRLIWTDVETRTSRTIHESALGRATVLNERGETPGDDAIATLTSFVEALPDLRCVVIAGSLPDGLSADAVAELTARTRRKGAAVIVDGGGTALIAAAHAGASLLKPNAVELREARPLADPVTAARSLLDDGADSVVVTRGERGMLVVDRSGVRTARLSRTLRGNPTGAGDAATAAFAAGLAPLTHLDDRTIATAVAWSAAAVLAPVAGALAPGWPALLDEVRIDRLTDDEETTCPW